MISKEYKALNKSLHVNSLFGTGGYKHAEEVLKLSKYSNTEDVLDYGCGKSTLAKALPFKIKQYDPAIDEYNKLPKPAHIVACTDVLEHIEPEYLEAVLQHLKELTLEHGYFVISTREAKKFLPDGRNAHLIVKNATWWKIKLMDYFQIKISEESHDEVKLVVSPKK
jgi:hypothetical protein